MSASRVEVGDGAPDGSEHDQCLAEIRRLKAEIEGRNAPMMAEIQRLKAEIEGRNAPMMAEIRRLTAENGVLLRERERDGERQRAWGTARHPTGRRTSLLTFRL
jgi:hypothetical protein